MGRLRVRVLTTMLAAALVALAAGTLLILRWRLRRPPAEDLARRYLGAIAAGDSAHANELFDPADIDRRGFVQPVDDSLLASPALAGAIERISDVRIDRVSRALTRPVASLSVSYALGGSRYTSELRMRWTGRTWRLTSGLWSIFQPRLSTSIVAAMILVGGAPARRPELTAQRGMFLAYPGVYELVVRASGSGVSALRLELVGGPRLVGVELDLP